MAAIKNIRKKKMIAQEGKCYYCNLPMWDNVSVTAQSLQCGAKAPLKALRCTAEHLQPRSEGGMNTVENIVAACLYCNSSRHRRKLPLSPTMHRRHVQKRMAEGRWLTTQFASWSSVQG